MRNAELKATAQAKRKDEFVVWAIKLAPPYVTQRLLSFCYQQVYSYLAHQIWHKAAI